MPYTLAYKDRFVRAFSPITGDECESLIPFPFLEQTTPNRITYNWTGAQITRMFSALKTGADLMFPDVANDILWDYLKGLSCLPELDPEESGCVEYSNSAPFIIYYPDNPYIMGDNAFGWNNEAWYRWGDFDTLFPDWIDEWLSGFAGTLLGYEDTDILCNIASLGYVSWLAFLNDGGVFPKIEIRFSGTGVIELELLKFPLGGKVVVELDEEPNVLDILTSGVFDPASFVDDLNRDVLSFPPDEYPVSVIEVPVETAGEHVLYVVFIPVVDDETTFLRFGGGLRSIEMCGFEEVGSVGIESIVWDGCALKSITGGIETVVVTAEEIQACLDIPEGGGSGGAAAFLAKSFTMRLAAATFTTTNTSGVAVQGTFYTPTYSNMLVIAKAITAFHSTGAGHAGVSVRFGGAVGAQSAEGAVQGTSARQTAASARFAVTPSVGDYIQIYARSQEAGTTTINDSTDWVITVLEYDDLDALFVEDVRYLDGVLEKKIGGVWFDIVDIEALLAPIQSLASAAHAAAAAAQADADIAIAVNSAQQVVINNHETRIDTLESDVADLTLSVSQHNLDIANHEMRIDALEAAGGGSGEWGFINLGAIQHLTSQLNPTGGIYSISVGAYDNGGGGEPAGIEPAGGIVQFVAMNAMRYGSCIVYGIGVSVLTDGGSSQFFVSVNNAEEVELKAVSGNMIAWLVVHPHILLGVPVDFMKVHVREVYSGVGSDWRVTQANYLCAQINPFTTVLFP